MQAIIGRSVGGAEGSTAFFAAVESTSALRSDVEGVANDVAFSGLSTQRAVGVGTGARSVLALLRRESRQNHLVRGSRRQSTTLP